MRPMSRPSSVHENAAARNPSGARPGTPDGVAAVRGAVGRALRAHGGSPALVDDRRTLDYRRLADLVVSRAAELPSVDSGRRLLAVEATNTVEFVVDYLAAIEAGHVVLLLPDSDTAATALTEAWAPDLVLGDGREITGRQRRVPPRHTLHPELQLLLSTSGSTGSPKLVRLSRTAVLANARAIVEYLGIVPGDRAITTLPPYYCYGLSVIHSHLLAGASVVLNDVSVSRPEFWDRAGSLGVTTFAGVPHTYEMIARLGHRVFDRIPTLRYLTQAGGRLGPEGVRELADALAERDAELVVMYGQTEATARMGYLPPHLVRRHPGAVGVAIPGGTFRIDPRPGAGPDDPGELVYSGPNVMMGYARTPADLDRGAELTELRTGDLARWTEYGLVEIVGRLGREVKIFGRRIDLGQVETGLAGHGVTAWCVGETDRLTVVLAAGDGAGDPGPGARDVTTAAQEGAVTGDPAITGLVAELTGLSPAGISVLRLDEPPRTPAGKIDHAALRVLVDGRRDAAGAVEQDDADRPAPPTPSALVAASLGLDRVPGDSSFVDLGGDSLTYVVLSTRLEEMVGGLPRDWHLLPMADLDAMATAEGEATGPGAGGRPAVPASRRWVGMDVGIVLRALFIVVIVASHTHAVTIIGGAHVLVALAGHSMARFRLHDPDPWRRARGVLRTAGRIIGPAVVWLALVTPLTSRYHWYNVLLGVNVFGPRSWWADRWWNPWQMWFVEAVVYALVLTAAMMAVPAVTRLDRRHPLLLPASLVAVGALVRFRVIDLGGGPQVWYSAPAVLWLFALGWAVARSRRLWHRLACTAVVAVAVPGWFGDPPREAVIAAGLCALIWLRTIRLPRPVTVVLTPLAAASLFIYLTHFLVYPPIRDAGLPWTATAVSLAVGLAAWWVWETVARRLRMRAAARRGATVRDGECAAG